MSAAERAQAWLDSGDVNIDKATGLVSNLLAELRRKDEAEKAYDEFVRAYDSLDHALDNLLDYLKLVGWSKPMERNIKSALMWSDRVATYYGHCNAARAVLAGGETKDSSSEPEQTRVAESGGASGTDPSGSDSDSRDSR